MNKVGLRGVEELPSVTQLVAEMRLLIYVYIQQIFIELMECLPWGWHSARPWEDLMKKSYSRPALAEFMCPGGRRPLNSQLSC